MENYRNIDALLMDSTTFINIGKKVVFSDAINLGDEVTLKTDKFSMSVRISEILDNVTKDLRRYRGTVLTENSPKKIEDWIQVGELVEFSAKKISGKNV